MVQRAGLRIESSPGTRPGHPEGVLMRITIVKAVAAGTVASIALAGIAFAPTASEVP